MTLITMLIFGGGFVCGWLANQSRKQIGGWIRGLLRKANEKAKDL